MLLGECCKRRHLTGAVDEGKAVFCREFNWNQSFFEQHFLCRNPPLIGQNVPLAHQGKGEVGQRGQIPACAQATDSWDERVNVVIEEGHKLLNAFG